MSKATTISKVQHRVLKAISSKALRRTQILEKAFKGGSANLKPILTPLVKAGLIKEDTYEVDGKEETDFVATAAGRKIAEGPAPQRASKVEHQPLPKVGGSFEKKYKGKTINVSVVADGFRIGSKTYTSLTAAAKAIRRNDMEVNGWAFFGLTK